MLGPKLSVKDAVRMIRFDRVQFVDKNLEGKNWIATSHYLSKEELVNDYGDHICQPNVVRDNEGFNKYSLLVWVDSDDEHVKNNFFRR